MFEDIKKGLSDSYFVSSLYHVIRLHKELRKSDNPILIYQMGKVGSTAIIDALKQAGLIRPVFHIHYLNEDKLSDAENRLEQLHGKRRNANAWCLKESRFVIDKILRSHRYGKLDMITLVREPVSRNVSSFFYNLKRYHPEFISEYLSGSYTVGRLISEIVSDNREREYVKNWFDVEMKAVTGIDVYDVEFPKEKGFVILENNRWRLLILKLEKLKECIHEAVYEFLQLKTITLGLVNSSEEREYNNAYKEFTQAAALPKAYLDDLFGSKYARQFYTDEEISLLRDKWRRSDSSHKK